MNAITTAKAPRFLIISTLRLGDALLVTPLIRSLRKHHPDSVIDVLVLEGVRGIFEGNPDIDRIIEVAHRRPFFKRWREIRQLWRRYSHALAPVSSDRARFYGFVAAPTRIGFINPHTSALSRSLLTHALPFDDHNIHTVPHNLRLLEPLNIPKDFTVVPPTTSKTSVQREDDLVVIHPYPKFRYKSWPMEHWIRLINGLVKQTDCRIILTGGSDTEEIAFTQAIARPTSAINRAGQLTLAETADLIRSSRLFIGPDTGITHIAAATGTPTVALFGPTNPVKWGPWPWACQETSPWQDRGSQQCGNVFLIQGEGDCVPCHQEGCDQHPLSASHCLDTLEVARVEAIALSLYRQNPNILKNSLS